MSCFYSLQRYIYNAAQIVIGIYQYLYINLNPFHSSCPFQLGDVSLKLSSVYFLTYFSDDATAESTVPPVTITCVRSFLSCLVLYKEKLRLKLTRSIIKMRF